MHLVPKYTDEFEWGDVFAMNPGKTYLTDEQYQLFVDKVQRCLGLGGFRGLCGYLSDLSAVADARDNCRAATVHHHRGAKDHVLGISLGGMLSVE